MINFSEICLVYSDNMDKAELSLLDYHQSIGKLDKRQTDM